MQIQFAVYGDKVQPFDCVSAISVDYNVVD